MPVIRVIVVDDSALVRSLLSSIINSQPDMKCIGVASDPLVAREMIRELNPDVITLDVEMPRMDGLDFLGRLMRLRPMPVIMISTLTEKGADVTMRALELGAIDFVTKPQIGQTEGLNALSEQIVEKLRTAAQAKVFRVQAQAAVAAPKRPPAAAGSPGNPTRQLIAIGASTGGTEAIREVITHLPAEVPGIVITQHMPPRFTASFAARLDGLSRISVREAVDGETVLTGHAYIAPGGQHMTVERRGGQYVTVISDQEPVNRHKPSVEVLFRSVARVAGPNALGLMLTGMGADGAQAMREMKDRGSYNYVQDEATCVVFGMPREAIRAGAAHEVLPLNQIAPALLERLRTHRAV